MVNEAILIIWMTSYGCIGGGGYELAQYCTVSLPAVTVTADSCDKTGKKFVDDFRTKVFKSVSTAIGTTSRDEHVRKMMAGYICAPSQVKRKGNK